MINKINKTLPRPIVVSANKMDYHRMIIQGLRDSRNVVNNYELFSSSLVGLAAKVIADHGKHYGRH